MCGDIFAARVDVLRVRCCHLRAGFQQCKSFVEMVTVRCCPLSGAEDCMMILLLLFLLTSARCLWRAPLVSHPRRHPTSCSASPSPLSAQTVAGCLLG